MGDKERPLSFGRATTLVIERITEPVQGMHRVIAGRWFGAVGRVAKPVRLAHDTTSTLVYESIRLAGNAAGVVLDTMANVRPSIADGFQAFAGGLWGEHLGVGMSLRDRTGAPIAITDEAFPHATGHIVILVHGLAVTERCWQGTESSPGLLHAVEDHEELTPLTLRYDSGQPVAGNGRMLASLLEQIHSNWPVPIESISLVGHSMGGLVVRSACQTARTGGHEWINDVTDIVTLGSPYLGAPLEKLADVAARGLSVAEVTRPLSEFLNARSEGIKDLRSGPVLDSDVTDPPIRHHLVAGVFTQDRAHPLGAAFGDLMVRVKSATAMRRSEAANVVVVGGVNHSALVRDAAVNDHVMGWLQPE